MPRVALLAVMLVACSSTTGGDGGLDVANAPDVADAPDALPDPGCPGSTVDDLDAAGQCPAALPPPGSTCALAADACCVYGVTACGSALGHRRCTCTGAGWYCACVLP